MDDIDISYWNYRVLRREDDFPKFGVYEVYYNEDDEPISHTKNPAKFEAEREEDLMKRLGAMKQAISKPVLSYEDLEEV